MSWSDERLDQFNESVSDYGSTFIFSGHPYDCLAPPAEESQKMGMNNYSESVPLKLSMRQSDFVASGLHVKSLLVYAGFTFAVYSIANDPVDPSVDLRCNFKQ